MEQPWTDADFPPVFGSLFKHGSQEDQVKYRDKFEWKRITAISESPKVFADGISPSDVSQGSLADCYFLAALSSMAEFPENIKALFETKTINSAGIYQINFFINGLQTSIVVDDYLPVVKGT